MGSSSGKSTESMFRGHLLVVEDNAVNQKVVCKVLEKRGLTFDVAENGFQAVKAVNQRFYDLILMDCHMPEMDGYAATAEIRRHPNSVIRHIPIVALTADPLPETNARCLASGMDACLQKPLHPLEFWTVLSRFLPFADEAQNPSALRQLQLMNQPGQPDFAFEMIDAFLQKSHTQFRALRDAWKKRDLAALGEVAHSLKSASAALGANEVSTLAAQLETEATAGRPDQIPVLLRRLLTARKAATQWLIDFKTTSPREVKKTA